MCHARKPLNPTSSKIGPKNLYHTPCRKCPLALGQILLAGWEWPQGFILCAGKVCAHPWGKRAPTKKPVCSEISHLSLELVVAAVCGQQSCARHPPDSTEQGKF